MAIYNPYKTTFSQSHTGHGVQSLRHKRILAYLRGRPGKPATCREIADALGLDPIDTSNALTSLRKGDRVKVVSRGLYRATGCV